MDLSALPAPVDDDAPSGENLEYDPLFTALELAARPGEGRQIGDHVIDAEEPDFKEVAAKADAVLERSHDLRAAVHLAGARLRLEGLPAFAEVTGYLRRCLEDFWDTCHPQLDPDDGDPTMRVNAILNLADSQGVLRALRLTPLTESRTFGRFSLRDIAIADGEVIAEGEVVDAKAIAAAFQESDPAEIDARRQAARSAADDVDAIGRAFDERVPGLGPDLGALTAVLRKMVKRFGEGVGEEVEPKLEGEPSAAAAARTQGGGGGAVNSRGDVTAALDRIMAYYASNEPSSPIPVLLARAKRLVNADFLAIMKDMAPSGLENVRLIGGLDEEES